MRVLTLLAFLLFPGIVFAEETAVADHALTGDEIALHDGRTLRLAGVKAAGPEAKDRVDALVAGKSLVLEEAAPDRYGRIVSAAWVQGQKASLEDVLLSEGLAFVYPLADEERIETWLDNERAARKTRRGYWATNRDVAPSDASKLVGSYGFVSGVVSKAEHVKTKVFLSFGAAEKPDFMVVVAGKYARQIKKLGIDLAEAEGKTFRARGWMTNDFGPSIVLTNAWQIEFLSASALATQTK